MVWIDKHSSMWSKKPQIKEDKNSDQFFLKFLFFLKLILIRKNNFVIFSKNKTINLETILSGRVNKDINFILLPRENSLLKKEARQFSNSMKETISGRLPLLEILLDKQVSNVKLKPRLFVLTESHLRECLAQSNKFSRETSKSTNSTSLIDDSLSISLFHLFYQRNLKIRNE